MQSVETEAKTVEEAIQIACEQLHTTKDALHIEILNDGPGKLLSLFSNKKAKIRASLDGAAAADENSVDVLKETLETIVKQIYSPASVEVNNENGDTILNIVGDGSGIFIGKKGQTLEAFQYLLNKIRIKNFRNSAPVYVDSESYRTRHTESLVNLARNLSDKAKKRNGPVTTSPMNPKDRRIIHMTLKQDKSLTTWSKGEGTLKKVIIAPKQK